MRIRGGRRQAVREGEVIWAYENSVCVRMCICIPAIEDHSAYHEWKT